MAAGGDALDTEDSVFREEEDVVSLDPQRSILATAVKAGDTKDLSHMLRHQGRFRDCDLSYTLRLAVHIGDIRSTQILLESLVFSCNFQDDISTSLIDSAIQGHVEITGLLLNNGASVDYVRSLQKRSALHEAAQRGHRQVCEVLVNAGANVNLGDNTWMTPLMLAASHNKVNIIELLVKRGSLVNIKDKYGESALFKAVDRGFLKATYLLVGMSADCNVRRQGKFGNTLLHVAAKRNDPRILRLLLDNGDNAKDVCNFLDQTPFHIALLSAGEECIGLLLDHGADPNRVDHEWTPLMRAASRGMPNVVHRLLLSGAHVNARNMRERTALHKAVTSGCLDVVKLLTRARADVNASCRGGFTPLHLAASQVPSEGMWNIMLELLRSGCNINAVNAEKQDASRLSLTDFYLPTASVLYLAGAHPRHIRALIRNCMDNLDSVISFLCGTDFRHVNVYKPDIIRDNVYFLNQATHNPRSLQNMCCILIRQRLGRDFESKCKSLPLPTDLKARVNFKDVEHLKPYFSSP